MSLPITENVTKKLSDVAKVKAGYPFRGKVLDLGEGPAVVGMKNVEKERGVIWNKLPHTKLTGKREPDWLTPKHILFVARGNHNFAVFIKNVPEQAVCAPQFFLITKVDEQRILAEFLSWWINQTPSQNYLSSRAEGTTTLSIRRPVLEDLPIPQPSLEIQKQIIQLNRCIQQERVVLNQFLVNRQKQIELLAQSLTQKTNTY